LAETLGQLSDKVAIFPGMTSLIFVGKACDRISRRRDFLIVCK